MNNMISVRDCLADCLSSYRIRTVELDENSENLEVIDFNYRGELFQDFNYKSYFHKMISHVSQSQPIIYSDGYGMRYLVYEDFDLPGKYFICGPFLYAPPFDVSSDKELDDFLLKREIPVQYKRQVIVFFSRIVMIKDILAFRQLINKIFTRILGAETLVYEYSEKGELEETKARLNPSSQNMALDYAALEARYDTENKMLKAIQEGNVKDALYYHNQFMGFTLEERGPDSLSSAKLYIIAANTIFRKAAERAQVHPLYIDQLNGKLTMEIEAAKSLVELNNFNTTMIRRYCMLVKTYSRDKYSALIRDCLNYIDFHYQEKLSLQYLSDKYSVSKNYLSTLFHKEVKMTMTDYINETRIRQAIILLNTTSLPMQQIAEQCGFTGINYFIRIFKKSKGMSPLKYRQSIMNRKD